MKKLLGSDFHLQTVTEDDLTIASICWGFTLGFGFLTTWTALKQTDNMYKRYGLAKLNTPYVWMIWLEILVCLSFSILCWLYIRGFISPSFAYYFCILTLWALQVQFLLQIIINRVAVLMLDRRKAFRLKVGVAIFITCINISVYCIWIPARLQISETYIRVNEVWDRCEKCIYLVVDAWLNWYFMRVVRKNLVKPGLKKYQSLVRFNMSIIAFSLAMDVLIIGMMSLRNSFVYMQFHPLAYIVKLNIEMSMAELISKVAREQNTNAHGAVVASSTAEKSGPRSQMGRDEKRNTLAKVDGFHGVAPSMNNNQKRDDNIGTEEMELGILKNSGPPSNSTEFERSRDERSSSLSSEDSENDNEFNPGARYEIRRKQEVHIRVESAAGNNRQETSAQGYQTREQIPPHERAHSGKGSPNQDNNMGLQTQVWGTGY